MEKIKVKQSEGQDVEFENGLVLTNDNLNFLQILKEKDGLNQSDLEINIDCLSEIAHLIIDLYDGKPITEKQILRSLADLIDIRRDLIQLK